MRVHHSGSHKKRNRGKLQSSRAPTTRSDQQKWEIHYNTHFKDVLRYLRRLIGRDRAALAEDLAQEAFAVAFANRTHFHGKSSLQTWICGIALNLVRNHLAREAFANRMIKSFSEIDFNLGQALADEPHLLQLRQENSKILLSIVAALPDNLLDAFVMCCIFGVNQEEVAVKLGVSVGNLRVRIARAKAAIKRRVAELESASD